MENSILIFGGGDLQISIIRKAKKLGYKTIVLDPNSHAPGKNYCDKFYDIDGNDYEKTLEIAKYHNVVGVVTAATDHPILMMCRIANALNLPFPTFNSCETLLNKGKFKYFLSENNIKHAKGRVYDFDEIVDKNAINFPVILKPVKNSGSRGVLKCEKSENLQRDVSECKSFCNKGQFIIEEFISGDEISVEAFVINNKVQIVQITDKIITSPPYNVELGHIQPSKYDEKREEIIDILQKIVNKLDLNNCVLHPEIKIDNGKLTIIEIGPRLGGDNITSLLVPLSTGIDMEALQINIATGKKIDLTFLSSHSLISFLDFSEDKKVIDEISFEELSNIFPDIVEFKCSLKKGDIINPITNSLNRYGYFVISNLDRLELLKKEEIIKNYLSSKILSL